MAYRWQTTEFSELNTAELYAALRLRQEIFVNEQDCIYQDLDNLDQGAIHILCWQEGELLAYQRCLPPGTNFTESAIGRILVSSRARGRDLGRELVKRGISHNLQRWPDHNIRINAQAYLETFYADLGFVPEGNVFDEDGIAHIHMVYARPG